MREDYSRRALLATLGVGGLAGCLASPDAGDTQTDATTSETSGATATPTPAADPPDSVTSEWPLPAHDPGRSHHTAAATGPTAAVTELWETTSDAVLSGPVVADQTVYVGGQDGVVRTFDVRTGEPGWEQSVGETAGRPRFVEGRLSVPVDGTLVGLDAGDGTERWRVDPEERIGDFVAADHGLYYVTDSPDVDQHEERPSVVAREPNGDERWRTTIADPWEPTVFASDQRVFVPTDTHDTWPWMLGTDTGEVLNDRRPRHGADFPSARLYQGGRVISVDGFFGNVRALTTTAEGDGWSSGLGRGGRYAVSGGQRVHVLYDSYEDSPVELFALDPSTGETGWDVAGLAGWTQPALATSAGVYVNTGQHLRCFDSGDGTELWRRPAGDVGEAFVIVDDLVVTTDGSAVRAFRPP